MHIRSVGLRSMTGKDVIVDLPGYVPLDFFLCNRTIDVVRIAGRR